MEVIRRRAKHRLIGSAVLVLAGIVGFPILFDTQPRPIAVDIPIEIPAKNSVKPLATPAAALAPAAAVTPPAAPASLAAKPAPEKVSAAASLAPKEEIITDKKVIAPIPPASAAIKKEVKPVLRAEVKPEAKPEIRPELKPEVKTELKPLPKAAVAASGDDGNRAKALLDGKTSAAAVAAVKPAAAATESVAAAADLRLIVQVGAYADVVKAREARVKLEKAGLKTYTQVAETADGKRIRVRVGPFATRAEAEKAASKIKTLDLPAAILTL
ncbi:MAG: SPOR domain-containing protein [Pseudomonadota bacterium]